MDDERDLIDRLCTAAGMIMEDSVDMAILRSASPDQGSRVEAIATAGRDIAALAAAAAVIGRRWSA